MIDVLDMKKYEKDIITWRRDFHKHPEIGFKEVRTSKKVADLLEKFGLEVVTGIAKTGVIGILRGENEGKTIALRADMDALGMDDEIDAEYRSINKGVAHTCGHDAHTAMLLGTAKYLSENKHKIKGTVKFIFQPAEEGPPPGGAKLIVESPIMDDIDAVFGLHVDPYYDAGKVGVKPNEFYAASDFFQIDITGIGTHGAYPHLGRDPIIVAVQIISALQNIISREIDPLKSAVISVGNISGGNANNVIPQNVTFGGSIRTLDAKVREYIINKVKIIVKHISELNGCKYNIKLEPMCPLLVNDKELFELVYDVSKETVGKENTFIMKSAELGSEDFSWFTKKTKTEYFILGVKNIDKGCTYYCHHPKFNLDEEVLIIGSTLFVNIVDKYLAG